MKPDDDTGRILAGACFLLVLLIIGAILVSVVIREGRLP